MVQNLCRLFDFLSEKWHGPAGHRFAGSLVVICFISALILVELKKIHLIEVHLADYIPNNFLSAIEVALTLVLIIEIMGLIFSIVSSMTTSVGRQLEILSLILLRDVFKEISHIQEPVVWGSLTDKILPIVSTSVGALIIFAIIGLFYRIKTNAYVMTDEGDKRSFIKAKKVIALFLLVAFHSIIIENIIAHFTKLPLVDIFESFYTLLIFSDILIVLLSMRYGHDYEVAFRNSGFAVVTLFIRIALIAPPLYSGIIGVGTALFALAVISVFTLIQCPPKQGPIYKTDR